MIEYIFLFLCGGLLFIAMAFAIGLPIFVKMFEDIYEDCPLEMKRNVKESKRKC